MRLAICLLLVAAAYGQDGRAPYRKYCAQCHEGNGTLRIPQRQALQEMTPERILHSLDEGVMRRMATAMSQQEKRAVAEFLTGKRLEAGHFDPEAGRCEARTEFTLGGPMWNGWGVDLRNTRFQNAEAAGLTASDVPRLSLRWAFGFPGDINAFAQPVMAGGRVFVGSMGGRVFSLDARTGCTHWWYEAEASVRTAVVLDDQGGAFFGDLKANVYAVEAGTGKLLWKTTVDEHEYARITGSPQYYDGRVYVPVASAEETVAADPAYECCTFRGSVAALDASTGKTIWKTYTVPGKPRARKKNKTGTQLYGPSGAGVWSAPTIDVKRGAIYITTGDNYSDPTTSMSDAFIALDMKTGKMLWSRQMTPRDAWNAACIVPDRVNCPDADGPDFDFGASPILLDLPGGKRALIAGQKSGYVHALDPDDRGRVLWQMRVSKGGNLGGIQWGSASDGEVVYVGVSDQKIDPQRTKAAGRVMLDPAAGGGLYALDAATGKQMWHTPAEGCGQRERCSPAQSAAVTAIPGVAFSGSVDGHLRAYATDSGKVIWDFDTAREYETVNRVKADGGSLDAAGPAVAGGMIFVNSGYGQWGGMPGNVLLAFGTYENQ